jgi:hypothetical protein
MHLKKRETANGDGSAAAIQAGAQTHPDIKRIGRAQDALPCGLAHSIARLFLITRNDVRKACELNEGDRLCLKSLSSNSTQFEV